MSLHEYILGACAERDIPRSDSSLRLEFFMLPARRVSFVYATSLTRTLRAEVTNVPLQQDQLSMPGIFYLQPALPCLTKLYTFPGCIVNSATETAENSLSCKQ